MKPLNIENEYCFDDSIRIAKKSSINVELKNFIWNWRTKEFLGRDSASWGKLSLFYSAFFLWLGTFFVVMLGVFMQVMPRDKPTYYGESGTIAVKGLNPALGFRPQIDVESHVISLNLDKVKNFTIFDNNQKYFRNLASFLNAKYDKKKGKDIITCSTGVNYTNDFLNGKSCEFDYKTLFKETPCTEEKNFGYETEKPCVLLKLNKIIDFVPLNSLEIKCEADGKNEKSNLKGITYYTERGEHKESAPIDLKYFPFNAQQSYKSPFAWVQFEVVPNVLVNIECRALAGNIDYDRRNRRGLTKLSLFIQKN